MLLQPVFVHTPMTLCYACISCKICVSITAVQKKRVSFFLSLHSNVSPSLSNIAGIVVFHKTNTVAFSDVLMFGVAFPIPFIIVRLMYVCNINYDGRIVLKTQIIPMYHTHLDICTSFFFCTMHNVRCASIIHSILFFIFSYASCHSFWSDRKCFSLAIETILSSFIPFHVYSGCVCICVCVCDSVRGTMQ